MYKVLWNFMEISVKTHQIQPSEFVKPWIKAYFDFPWWLIIINLTTDNYAKDSVPGKAWLWDVVFTMILYSFNFYLW